MFEKRKEIAAIIVVLVVAITYLFFNDKPAESKSESVRHLILPNKASVTNDVLINEEPLKKRKGKETESIEPLTVEKGMQHEMQRVADIYEKRSQYAPYSLYLSPAQTDLIHPNQTHESPRTYDVDGQEVSILIEPANYRFTVEEIIDVNVQIRSSEEGLDSISKLEINLMETGSRKQWPMKIAGDSKQGRERVLKTTFDLGGELADFSGTDYSIVVKASFNNESPVIQSAPIKIVTSIAEVKSIGVNRIENNDLIIPVNIDADDSGYYQLSASLFDQRTNSAISFLIAKDRLSSGSNTLNIKVQGLVLIDKGFSGPFRLQGITLVKKSERPGMAEEYGTSEESYVIEAIDLNNFEAIPYEDPLTEQRLEFLRSIGQ